MVPQLRRLNICVGGVDPLLTLKVWGLNPALSENTSFLPYFFFTFLPGLLIKIMPIALQGYPSPFLFNVPLESN